MATAGTTSAPDLRRHPCGFAPPVRSLPLHDHRHGPAFEAFFRARIAVYFAESGVAIAPAAFFEKKKEGYFRSAAAGAKLTCTVLVLKGSERSEYFYDPGRDCRPGTLSPVVAGALMKPTAIRDTDSITDRTVHSSMMRIGYAPADAIVCIRHCAA